MGCTGAVISQWFADVEAARTLACVPTDVARPLFLHARPEAVSAQLRERALMQSHRPRTLASLLIGLIAISACGDGSTDPRPIPLPPLAAASWHLHAADGDPLPALVVDKIVAGAVEQTWIDSARLVVVAQGRWERRAYLQRFRNGDFLSWVLSVDAGSWAVTDTGYLFSSDGGDSEFVLREVPHETITLSLEVDVLPDPITTTLRLTPPPPTPTGFWKAEAVHGLALPAAIYVFDPYEENGREMSIHLVVDSVSLALHPTGRYRHRIWYTEWEGNTGGTWHTVRSRWTLADFGAWTRNGEALQLDSEWLQNHRMTGTFSPVDRSLAMQHGLTHGDPPATFRYRR